MNFKTKLANAFKVNDSLLCVGLDPDPDKLPAVVRSKKEPLFNFNKAIIDTTCDLVCAFKLNSAFYEGLGDKGLAQAKKTCDYIHKKCPGVLILIDAKRADIGNTNSGYVKYIYEYLGADALTLHPYLGEEALEPFLTLKDRGSIILCRTSNPGASEFQDLITGDKPLYQQVALKVAKKWNKNNNCMLVVGATYPKEMKIIRKLVGNDMAFLVPGVGAQGGNVEKTLKAGLNDQGTGLIISSSREIIFASSKSDFADKSRDEAVKLKEEINKFR